MLTCERCGTENTDDARFCKACGAALAGPEAPLEERKLVSVLFVDLVGSTSAADGADPEDVRDTLKLYYERVRDQIARYDGTVEKFIGDAVVAVFGAPRAHGDDAVRAVRCGLQVLDAIEHLNHDHPELSLAIRAAVNTGEAVVALGSAHERGEALATGDVLNVAARLQSAAPPGRLVVGADTYRATRRSIRYDPLPPIEAKGKKEPVEVWLAVEPAIEVPVEAPATIVGRDRELELLTAIWERVTAERRPHLVTVLGPPGIGKSALSSAFGARVESDGARHIRGRCLPYEEQAGYRASADHVKEIAGILDSDPPTVAKEKLTRTVDRLMPPEESVDVGRYLSLLLGLGLDAPIADRLPLFFAVRRLVEAIAADRPAVVAFEDVHWAGTSQLDLLEYLASHIRETPILLLALARPELAEQRPTWGGGMLAQTTIPLEPLSADASKAIAAGLLGSSEAVDRLVEVAGGNPLFVEELAASLSEGGGGGSLPTSVREAIASRIDVLPPEQRSVLMDAAIVGKTFWRGVVGAVGEGVDIDRTLDALEARDLIRRAPRSQVEHDHEFSFKHILIREVAYGTIPRATRRERHAAVAAYIEGLPEKRQELAWLLAHHWREAGEVTKAVEYLMLAAERAREGWAKEESVALYDQALDLVGESDPELRTKVRLARGLGFADVSDFDRCTQELVPLLPDLDPRAELEAVLRLSLAAQWLEDGQGAMRYGDRAVELAEGLGDPVLIPPAIAAQAASRIATGQLHDSISLGERAADIWVAESRPEEFARLHELQSEVYYWIGAYETAEALARGAYQLGGELHNVEPLIRGGGWRALSLAAMGRTEEALSLIDSIIERSSDLGNPRWGAAPYNYSSLVFRDVFMLKEARRRNEAALELVEAVGEWGMPRMQAMIDMMITDLMEGDVGRAQREWPAVWEAAINGAAWRPWLGGCRLALIRASIAREAEGPEATIELARDSIERALKVPRPKYEAEARALLGSALVELGRAEGIGELRTAVEIADRLGSPTPRWRIRSDFANALYATGDDEGAAAAFGEAAEILRTYAATLSPERSASLLSAEPVAAVLKAAG